MRQGLIMSRRSSRCDLAVAELRGELRRSQRENRNLRRENEVLREAAAPLIHYAPARERFAFMHARRDRFGVKLPRGVLVTDGANYGACGARKCEFGWRRSRSSGLIWWLGPRWDADLSRVPVGAENPSMLPWTSAPRSTAARAALTTPELAPSHC